MRTVCHSTMTEKSVVRTTRVVFTIIIAFAAMTQASAADIKQGERLARQWCRDCHLISADQVAGGDTAPTFASIAETASERPEDLRAWLADPHPPMPNLDLTRTEIDDLLAYIESLGEN